MLKAGRTQTLTVNRISDYGLYLIDDEQNEVLLPNRYVSLANKVGDTLEVFVYHDSEDRLVATTETPKLREGEAGFLRVSMLISWFFWTDNRTETKLCVHIFMNGGITVRITFTLQIDFHTPIAVNSIVRMIYFLNLCLDFGFKGIIIRLPVFPVVVISIWAYTQPSKQPANAKFIMILFDESISL